MEPPSGVGAQLVRTWSASSSATSSSKASSFTTSSIFSHSTGSTIPGIGAISGKAILALGKATLRGAEHVYVQSRLASISSKFPHKDEDKIRGLTGIYDDLLDFTRPGMYSHNVRTRAFKLILTQIAIRQTEHLVLRLRRWDSSELELFVRSVCQLFDPSKLESDSPDAVVQTYTVSPHFWENHTLASLVDFLRKVSQSNNRTCRAVILGGALDLLLKIYLRDFRDPVPAQGQASAYDLRMTCDALLRALSSTKTGLKLLLSHPISFLWPTKPSLAFMALIPDRGRSRSEFWKVCDSQIIVDRIESISQRLVAPGLSPDADWMYDACVDLSELAGSGSRDIALSVAALCSLIRLFSRQYQQPLQAALQRYFSSFQRDHIVNVLQRIFANLILLSKNHGISSNTFLSISHMRINAGPLLIHAFLNISETGIEYREIFIDAGIVPVIRAYANAIASDIIQQVEYYEEEIDWDALQPKSLHTPPAVRLCEAISQQPPHLNLKSHVWTYPMDVISRAYKVFNGQTQLREVL